MDTTRLLHRTSFFRIFWRGRQRGWSRSRRRRRNFHRSQGTSLRTDSAYSICGVSQSHDGTIHNLFLPLINQSMWLNCCSVTESLHLAVCCVTWSSSSWRGSSARGDDGNRHETQSWPAGSCVVDSQVATGQLAHPQLMSDRVIESAPELSLKKVSAGTSASSLPNGVNQPHSHEARVVKAARLLNLDTNIGTHLRVSSPSR